MQGGRFFLLEDLGESSYSGGTSGVLNVPNSLLKSLVFFPGSYVLETRVSYENEHQYETQRISMSSTATSLLSTPHNLFLYRYLIKVETEQLTSKPLSYGISVWKVISKVDRRGKIFIEGILAPNWNKVVGQVNAT